VASIVRYIVSKLCEGLHLGRQAHTWGRQQTRTDLLAFEATAPFEFRVNCRASVLDSGYSSCHMGAAVYSEAVQAQPGQIFGACQTSYLAIQPHSIQLPFPGTVMAVTSDNQQ
jgi:hypothetical protein